MDTGTQIRAKLFLCSNATLLLKGQVPAFKAVTLIETKEREKQQKF